MEVAQLSSPWSNNSPRGVLDWVLRACFPSMESRRIGKGKEKRIRAQQKESLSSYTLHYCLYNIWEKYTDDSKLKHNSPFNTNMLGLLIKYSLQLSSNFSVLTSALKLNATFLRSFRKTFIITCPQWSLNTLISVPATGFSMKVLKSVHRASRPSIGVRDPLRLQTAWGVDSLRHLGCLMFNASMTNSYVAASRSKFHKIYLCVPT